MKAIVNTEYGSSDILQHDKLEKNTSMADGTGEAFAELERGVQAALETYSNVHRAAGTTR